MLAKAISLSTKVLSEVEWCCSEVITFRFPVIVVQDYVVENQLLRSIINKQPLLQLALLLYLSYQSMNRGKRSTSLPARATKKVPQKCYFYRKGHCKWDLSAAFNYIEKVNPASKACIQFLPPPPPLFSPIIEHVPGYKQRINQLHARIRKEQMQAFMRPIREQLMKDWEGLNDQQVQVEMEEKPLRKRLLDAWRDLDPEDFIEEEYANLSQEQLIKDLKVILRVRGQVGRQGFRQPSPHHQTQLGSLIATAEQHQTKNKKRQINDKYTPSPGDYYYCYYYSQLYFIEYTLTIIDGRSKVQSKGLEIGPFQGSLLNP